MAVPKSKRSVHKKQLARPGGQSTLTKAARRNRRRVSRNKRRKSNLLPGALALNERTLPGRRFVDFPQVIGKTIKRVHIFTAPDYNCVTIDLDDHSTLNLEIEPGFSINAQLQQIDKGNIEIIAEWPTIHNQT